MVPERKQKRRWKALLLLLIFFAGIAVAVFLTSPLSKVRSVEVVGNSQVPAGEIRGQSGVQAGMNFWEVKPSEVEEKLKNHFPLIAKADVELIFPGQVVIAVAEKPVAAILVHNEGTYYRLLSDATVFDAVKNPGETGLPLLVTERTFSVETGKRIPDPDIQSFCEQLVKADRSLLDHVYQFEIKKGNLWSAQTKERHEIRFPAKEIDVTTVLTIYNKFWKNQLEKDNKPPGIIHIYGPDEAWYDKRTN